MRSLLKLSLIAASISLITACGEKSAETKSEQTASKTSETSTEVAVTSDKEVALAGVPSSELDKQSYSLGVSFGAYLKRAMDENQKVDIVLNTDMVLSGVNDAISGKEKLPKKDIEAAMKALDQMTRTKHQELAEKQKAQALKDGTDFLAANAKKDGVKVTESGLQYKVITEGTGDIPGPKDRVKVHYRGTLMDGTEFDSSYVRDKPAVFGVNQVIKGWTEGLQLMKVGSKYSFVIPSNLAYGERATGKITANSTLLFDVELLSIESKGEDTAAHQNDEHDHTH